MHYLHQIKFLNQFRCIGGDCPQTCCSNWNIPLDDQDIHYYKKKPAVIAHLRDNFDFEAKKMCVQDKRCTNLNEEGLCKLQILSTHTALPLTCKLYPRLFVQYYNDLYAVATLSCPEIVNMVYDLATQPNSDKRLFLPPNRSPFDGL